ncbi:MAG TPA: hypothetical protein VNT79_10370 [Phycisphaerae bacterium]|nr:hypothetical protein [Phycisphaerae bacterium]
MKIRFTRTRKAVFWICVVLALLCSGGWVFSECSGLRYSVQTSSTAQLSGPGGQWALYPTVTLILIDGQLTYVDMPGQFLTGLFSTGFEIAWTSHERQILAYIAADLATINSYLGPLPFTFTVVVVPLWIPSVISATIAGFLFMLSRRAGRRGASADPSAEWMRRKRPTWKRAAISIPILIVSLICTPFLMYWIAETFFPSTDLENVIRRQFALSEGVTLSAALAIWLGLSYCIARIAFALTRWSQIRIFGDHRPCEKCGYDLMGNISGICPECGGSIPITERSNHEERAVSLSKRISK